MGIATLKMLGKRIEKMERSEMVALRFSILLKKEQKKSVLKSTDFILKVAIDYKTFVIVKFNNCCLLF